MFVVEITAVLVTAHLARQRAPASRPTAGAAGLGFQVQIAIWLWFTVLFATYAEAVAEARGRAQAATLRKTRSETTAHRRAADGTLENVGSSELRKGDIIVVEEGETIAGDGDVIEGVGFVNEAAITGESAPVLKEPGTDIRSSVTGGTTLVSDRLVIRVTADPGETFLDRMIALVEGAKRQRTPNEIALAILLAGLTIIFLMATVTLRPFGAVRGHGRRHRRARRAPRLPHPDHDRRPAVGDRHRRHGPRRALQRPGHERPRRRGVGRRRRDPARQDRHDHLRQPPRGLDHPGPRRQPRSRRSRPRSSPRSGTRRPEGRSIVELARKRLAELGAPAGAGDEAGLRARSPRRSPRRSRSGPRPARAASGRRPATSILKGAVDAIAARARRRRCRPSSLAATDRIADRGRDAARAAPATAGSLGLIELKDTVKEGLVERFAEFRKMGIRTVMITGDNPRTAATIAREAGVDDFIAEATPEDKIAFIRKEQADGHLVAMTGDGTNDAPALAQSDVGLAMNSGTSAAKEAANMVDLDSDPTKLLEVIAIGKQLLITRGSITTFSIANDVAKYFAILPAMFVERLPGAGRAQHHGPRRRRRARSCRRSSSTR